MSGALVLALIAAVVPPPARAAPAATALTDVYAALGVDAVATDHVILVDVSGSLTADRHTALRRGLTGLLAALPAEDFVTLIPYGRTAQATTRQAGREPGRLVAGLPGQASEPAADIGTALAEAVRVLDRPGAPPLATVLLLTGGPHEPGPGSAYPRTRGPAWTTLAGKAARLDKTSLEAYAVPFSGRTGAGLLPSVFPRAEVLALGDRLTGVADAARAAKARSLLAEQITLPVTVSWPRTVGAAGRSTAAVRVESPMPNVPLVLEDLAVTSDNPDVSVSVPAGPTALPPDRTITVPVRIDWDPGPVSVAPRRTVTGRVTLRLTATVTSPWSTVLAGDLGLTPRFTLAATPAQRELTAQRGSLWRWLGGLLLVVVLTAVLLRRRQRGSS